jgi:prolycopene isomerase
METFHSPISGMLTCYNVDDADAAPTGKSQVVLVCLQYADVWNNVAPEQYAKVKYEFADQLIDLIESTVCPEIRTHIEELEVATPLTMMRYLNSPGGAIYGFNQMRPTLHMIRSFKYG